MTAERDDKTLAQLVDALGPYVERLRGGPVRLEW